MLSHDVLWTLDELSAQVALALAVDYAGQSNGRVREVPDQRTIRYYTTLGLLDRPAEYRGRTALYGLRHLRQLVAVKRLQARGLALAEIQARLIGLTDRALAGLAQLPANLETGEPSSAKGTARPEEDRRGEAFWSQTPTAPPAEPVGAQQAGVGGEEARELRLLVGVPLAEHATLLLEAARPLDEFDLSALRVAAAPLLKLLEARRLLGVEGSPSTTKGDPS
jgi:DNA-binding transcriptional MerR regulator